MLQHHLVADALELDAIAAGDRPTHGLRGRRGLLEPGVYRRARVFGRQAAGEAAAAPNDEVMGVPGHRERESARREVPRGGNDVSFSRRFETNERRKLRQYRGSSRYAAAFCGLDGSFCAKVAGARFERIPLTVPRRPHKDGTSRSVRHRTPAPEPEPPRKRPREGNPTRTPRDPYRSRTRTLCVPRTLDESWTAPHLSRLSAVASPPRPPRVREHTAAQQEARAQPHARIRRDNRRWAPAPPPSLTPRPSSRSRATVHERRGRGLRLRRRGRGAGVGGPTGREGPGEARPRRARAHRRAYVPRRGGHKFARSRARSTSRSRCRVRRPPRMR